METDVVTSCEYALIEKTVSTNNVYEGKIITCKVKEIILPDGSRGVREIVEHNGGACILAIDNDKNTYLVRQFRSPFERVVLEVPAGKLEKDEDPYECASRELQEETGFKASKIIPLGKAYASPGYTSEVIYMYMATGLEFVGNNLDKDEYLNVEKISLEDLVKAVDEGVIVDGKSISCILKAKRRFDLGDI